MLEKVDLARMHGLFAPDPFSAFPARDLGPGQFLARQMRCLPLPDASRRPDLATLGRDWFWAGMTWAHRADDSRTRWGEGNRFRVGSTGPPLPGAWFRWWWSPRHGAWVGADRPPGHGPTWPSRTRRLSSARFAEQCPGGQQHRRIVHATYQPFDDSGPPLPERGERANGLRCRHVGVAIRRAMSYALGRGHRVWPHPP